MAKAKRKPVLVTTAHRGVFFGYLVGEPSKERTTITQARNCTYWEKGLRGFLGLASHGPSGSCRVGFAAPRLTLWDVTSVTECTPEAAAKWEGGPWQ